jgi:arabinofuranosyltransferase
MSAPELPHPVHRPADRTTVPLAILAALLAAYVALAAAFAWVGDDAFIAFRYGRNLAEGAGLRFNLGVDPPVEGYTQLAWILVVALIERLGLEIVHASRVVEITLGALLLAICVRRFATLEGGRPLAIVAGLLLLSSPGYVIWSTGGLGTLLFALSIFLCVDRVLATLRGGSLAQACAASALVVYVRFDGLYFVGVVLATAFLLGWLRSDSRTLVRTSLSAGAAVAIGCAAQTAWRLWYHGDWLPNTARAKGDFDLRTLERGFDYLVSNWFTVPLLAVALAAAVVLVARERGRDPWHVMALGLIGGASVYGVLTGGDFMPMGRFFVPALPFVALVGARLVLVAARERIWGDAVASALALGLLNVPALFNVSVVPERAREVMTFRWSWPYQSEIEFLGGMQQRVREWTQLGRALGQHVDPSESLVRGPIGAVGYYSRLTLFDQYGLVDREVTISARPDVDARTLPGHDLKVPHGFFAARRPTYLSADLLLGEYPGTPMYEAARPAIDSGLLVVHPVGVEDGFPERGTLALTRYWAPPGAGESTTTVNEHASERSGE